MPPNKTNKLNELEQILYNHNVVTLEPYDGDEMHGKRLNYDASSSTYVLQIDDSTVYIIPQDRVRGIRLSVEKKETESDKAKKEDNKETKS